MSLTRFTSETWPHWVRGLELAPGHLYGLENFLQARAALPGPSHGVDLFESQLVLLTTDPGKPRTLTVPHVRGVTPGGAPVAVDPQSPLICEIKDPRCEFDLRIRVNALEGAPDLSELEPEARPVLSRLAVNAATITAANQAYPQDASSLYLGRFTVVHNRLSPVELPWVRRFGALMPEENYRRWFEPMIAGLGELLRQLVQSPDDGLRGSKIAALVRFRAIWPQLPLHDLALECHALHVLLRQTLTGYEPPPVFDPEGFLGQFAHRIPVPGDFLNLAKAGWTPPRYSWRRLGDQEYTATRAPDGSAIMVEVSTHLAGYLLIHLPVETLRDGAGRPRTCVRAQWSQGNGGIAVDPERHFVQINLGEAARPQSVRLTDVCLDVPAMLALTRIAVWNTPALNPPPIPDNSNTA